jgi:hypothetical protein
MKVCFCGPTISKAQVREICPEVLVLPPAEQGSIEFVFRQLGATVIGLIDGVHTHKLPPWHKEILQVLEMGGRIFGAASMGALRAVECEPWGMEPVGEIARWYKDGIIEGDDEVCLAHGDESVGYRQLSVPLINVRATLKASNLSEERKEEILTAARSLFYPQRSWQRILEIAEVRKEEAREINEHQLDLKLADALHLVHFLQDPPEKPTPERQIKNAATGYGGVFSANDRKLFHSGHTIRLHEIADLSPEIRELAAQRRLAVEFAKLAGLQPKEMIPLKEGVAAGLTQKEAARLTEEQNLVHQAVQWMSSSRAGFGDVQDTLDFLRVNGLYEQRKNSLTGGG